METLESENIFCVTETELPMHVCFPTDNCPSDASDPHRETLGPDNACPTETEDWKTAVDLTEIESKQATPRVTDRFDPNFVCPLTETDAPKTLEGLTLNPTPLHPPNRTPPPSADSGPATVKLSLVEQPLPSIITDLTLTPDPKPAWSRIDTRAPVLVCPQTDKSPETEPEPFTESGLPRNVECDTDTRSDATNGPQTEIVVLTITRAETDKDEPCLTDPAIDAEDAKATGPVVDRSAEKYVEPDPDVIDVKSTRPKSDIPDPTNAFPAREIVCPTRTSRRTERDEPIREEVDTDMPPPIEASSELERLDPNRDWPPLDTPLKAVKNP